MLLRIQYNNNPKTNAFKGGPNHLKKYERELKKHLGAWKWATIYAHGKGAGILYYYHHTTGMDRLNKKQYQAAINSEQINLYIVYTPEEKKRRGTEQGQSIPNKSLAQMRSYYTKGVAKVMAFRNNKLIETYPA